MTKLNHVTLHVACDFVKGALLYMLHFNVKANLNML